MYIRKATRRRLYSISLIALALVLATPKVEVSQVPQLNAVLFAIGLDVPRAS